MRVVRVAAMIVLLSGPAFVQQAGEADKEKTPGQIQSETQAKEAYEKSLANIPDKGTTDPWGAVRNNDPRRHGPLNREHGPGHANRQTSPLGARYAGVVLRLANDCQMAGQHQQQAAEA
jgi:hypothetical protein